MTGRSQCSHLLCLKNCPFSWTLFKIPFCKKQQQCHCHCNMVQLLVGGKDSSWLTLFKKCTWYKKLRTLLVFLPRSLCESELLLPQRNRRSVILGCLYFKGDPCTVPGGSCDEMSHQIRNTILKFSCHEKKVLLWLYSSTESIPEKVSVSELFLFCFEWSSHMLNEKEISCCD